MKSITQLLILFVIVVPSLAEQSKLKIHIPDDLKLQEHYAHHFDRLEEPLKTLVESIKEPKDPEFIAASEATKNLPWRASSIVLISPEFVAVTFNEGHVNVIGIYSWNFTHKQWVLSAEHGGIFRDRAYKQQLDSTGEQDGAGQPATRPESKSEGSDKPQPESEGRSR